MSFMDFKANSKRENVWVYSIFLKCMYDPVMGFFSMLWGGHESPTVQPAGTVGWTVAKGKCYNCFFEGDLGFFFLKLWRDKAVHLKSKEVLLFPRGGQSLLYFNILWKLFLQLDLQSNFFFFFLDSSHCYFYTIQS